LLYQVMEHRDESLPLLLNVLPLVCIKRDLHIAITVHIAQII